MYQLQIMNQSQQVMKDQNSQLWMNQLINLSHMMMDLDQSQSQTRLNNRCRSYDADQFKFKNRIVRSSIKTQSNRSNRKANNNNNKKDLQQRKRLKHQRYLKNKKKAPTPAPLAPRNTTSFIIRAKKSGGIAVSPSPVTPAVLDTPVFSPCNEDLIDAVKEEWGIDGYGTMKGLIRVRSSGKNEDVEWRLDDDLSRFEMISPKYGVNDHKSCVLENRVNDQGTHIAQLEEQNLKLKERLLLLDRDFSNMRLKLQGLEMLRHGSQGFIEDI
ncbi:hypothetical protein QVD17_11286 [Tagetes erecta]|uniref:Uncharacterized protein n=1 Tax=Tagetes erecta TaxID=13708 RepID=A0AAD8L0D4_TARER|nr:hypothetical protein QVD17_11286 [Tagetes erecta]